MKLEYTQPKGPWQTRFVYQNGELIAMVRKQPYVGYQVVAENVFWKGRMGRTNSRFFERLKDAKGFCVQIAMGNVE